MTEPLATRLRTWFIQERENYRLDSWEKDMLRDAAVRMVALEKALAKIDAIRNSIIGCQNVNWSAHIYPLVAALNEAGVIGMSYEDAKAKYGGNDPARAIGEVMVALDAPTPSAPVPVYDERGRRFIDPEHNNEVE
jgi:hypothetical protein